jgi:hypothetical protein
VPYVAAWLNSDENRAANRGPLKHGSYFDVPALEPMPGSLPVPFGLLTPGSSPCVAAPLVLLRPIEPLSEPDVLSPDPMLPELPPTDEPVVEAAPSVANAREVESRSAAVVIVSVFLNVDILSSILETPNKSRAGFKVAPAFRCSEHLTDASSAYAGLGFVGRFGSELVSFVLCFIGRVLHRAKAFSLAPVRAHLREFFLGQVFDPNEPIVCGASPDQFVKLGLNRGAIPVLGILDEEDLEERDDRCSGCL